MIEPRAFDFERHALIPLAGYRFAGGIEGRDPNELVLDTKFAI